MCVWLLRLRSLSYYHCHYSYCHYLVYEWLGGLCPPANSVRFSISLSLSIYTGYIHYIVSHHVRLHYITFLYTTLQWMQSPLHYLNLHCYALLTYYIHIHILILWTMKQHCRWRPENMFYSSTSTMLFHLMIFVPKTPESPNLAGLILPIHVRCFEMGCVRHFIQQC